MTQFKTQKFTFFAPRTVIFCQKNSLVKTGFFVSSKIAKAGTKLLTFVKTARNADLEIAEK